MNKRSDGKRKSAGRGRTLELDHHRSLCRPCGEQFPGQATIAESKKPSHLLGEPQPLAAFKQAKPSKRARERLSRATPSTKDLRRFLKARRKGRDRLRALRPEVRLEDGSQRRFSVGRHVERAWRTEKPPAPGPFPPWADGTAEPARLADYETTVLPPGCRYREINVMECTKTVWVNYVHRLAGKWKEYTDGEHGEIIVDPDIAVAHDGQVYSAPKIFANSPRPGQHDWEESVNLLGLHVSYEVIEECHLKRIGLETATSNSVALAHSVGGNASDLEIRAWYSFHLYRADPEVPDLDYFHCPNEPDLHHFSQDDRWGVEGYTPFGGHTAAVPWGEYGAKVFPGDEVSFSFWFQVTLYADWDDCVDWGVFPVPCPYAQFHTDSLLVKPYLDYTVSHTESRRLHRVKEALKHVAASWAE